MASINQHSYCQAYWFSKLFHAGSHVVILIIDNESVRGSKECYGNTFPGKWSRVWALSPSQDPQMDSSSGQVT